MLLPPRGGSIVGGDGAIGAPGPEGQSMITTDVHTSDAIVTFVPLATCVTIRVETDGGEATIYLRTLADAQRFGDAVLRAIDALHEREGGIGLAPIRSPRDVARA